MSFLFNLNTKVHTETETKPVMNAINILKRDMAKVFGASDENGNDIHLKVIDNHNFHICVLIALGITSAITFKEIYIFKVL